MSEEEKKYPEIKEEPENAQPENNDGAEKEKETKKPFVPPSPMMMTVYAGPDYWNGGAYAPRPVPAQEPKQIGKYCAECGFPLKDTDKYCTECGAKVIKPE